MTTQPELPPEGDEEEARIVAARRPLELPKHRLEHVQIADLLVDYAPPAGDGYARPLSIARTNWLRRNWDTMAAGALTVSRRAGGLMYLMDGNHRRYVAWEYGIKELPAIVYTGLDRAREAELYTLLGTTLGQTPATRFRSKLVAGNPAALEIMRILEQYDFELDTVGGKHKDGVIQAVSRVEWLYARGGSEGLGWVLGILGDAFDGARDSISENMLEGTFGFWLRYSQLVDDDHLVKVLNGAGVNAIEDRADSINRRYVSTRGNAVGRAMLEMYNGSKRPAGAVQLPSWIDKVVGPNVNMDVNFRERELGGQFKAGQPHHHRTIEEAAPQQLVARA